jgi:hypothetical protein
VIEIPFRLASPEIPLILVSARVNGLELDVELDSGNGGPREFLIGADFARRLGLSIPPGPDPRVRLDRLELGGQVFEGVEAGVVAEIDDIAARGGFTAAGNMGYAFFRNQRIVIDYPGLRLLLPDGGRLPEATGVPFDAGRDGSVILFPAEVNGRGPYRFLLDTGASASVIFPPLAAELGLSGSEAKAVSVLGDLAAQHVTLDSLTALGHTRHSIDAAVIDIFDFANNATGTTVDGILGYSFLKDFVLEIDYAAHRLSLMLPQAAESGAKGD